MTKGSKFVLRGSTTVFESDELQMRASSFKSHDGETHQHISILDVSTEECVLLDESDVKRALALIESVKE